jgi:formylglycine-generating enzyme required for sulfatase activity
MVYVPAGRFLAGSNTSDTFRRDFLSSAPLHPVTTPAYLVAIHEVTFGEWIAYLRDVPAAERQRRMPGNPTPNGATLKLAGGRGPDEPFTLTLQATIQPLVAREDELLVYPGRHRHQRIHWERAPVSGISLEDARAYAGWLAHHGVPGARLCSEREWERAARGADGRTWPHGNRIEPDDANIDVTYDRDDLGWGPDEVGAHPASNSPFGLTDTAGNAWEWVERARKPTVGNKPRTRTDEQDEGDEEDAVQRGGSWYQGKASAEAANREFNSSKARQAWSGLRICATPK